MGPHASGIDALHQAGVLVNQPRFPQHVCCGVLQLKQSEPSSLLRAPPTVTYFGMPYNHARVTYILGSRFKAFNLLNP